MKNIIVTFVVFLCASISIKAQSTVCPGLQAFNGEWRYVNGPDTIKIFLRYNECQGHIGPNDLRGRLWGWHEYKRGSTIIESNYANRFMTLPTDYDNAILRSYSILLSLYNCDFAQGKLSGLIHDISQCYEIKTVIANFNSTHTQLSWSQSHREGFGFLTGCIGMTLPKYFVLTKQ